MGFIRRDGGTQPRKILDQAAVEAYAEAMKKGAVFPPVTVFYDGEEYWLADGFHRMSAADDSHKSLRYKLGELLRDTSDHMLMLTATPHKGDPDNFSLFLQLLDADAYADVRSIREAMDRRRAPFYLRRTKEAMVYFPERRTEASMRATFTRSIP